MENSSDDSFQPRCLPESAERLCTALQAPPRLVAHLTLVHDAAVEIVDGLHERFAKLQFDSEAVMIGSAIHGKPLVDGFINNKGTIHTQEWSAMKYGWKAPSHRTGENAPE